MMRLSVLATLVGVASAGVRQSNLRQSSLEVSAKKQDLRVCNAFPAEQISMIYKDKDLTDGEAMGYKECRKFELSIKKGDKFKFQTGNKSTSGVFTVWDVPECDAVLVLVPHKRAGAEEEVSFLSHAFCPAKTAQVAVIDAYNDKPAEMTIADLNTKDKASEKLSFDTVLGVAPGSYAINIKLGEENKRVQLEAKASESYVVIHTGWAAHSKKDVVPQDLIIFPSAAAPSETDSKSPKQEEKKGAEEKSGASTLSASLALVAIISLLSQ
eukprot:TRINITY_DN76019_c0_g1_i1.p1 TRINITY_DN76019_c0_g1~~TRINITY_DN76019_c0_g1_i1.p1  ORF type:complete len:269 (+),score=75.79 TRINITY_DN76019_c0_g1_i1:66-872(+)